MNSWLVVLNWNGRSDTLALLESLDEAQLPGTTVLVVDNGSSDGTLDAVEQEHPWVRTLQTGANLGYAGGNNRGIQLALDEGAEVIGVLNNDTLVAPGFWPPLVAAAARRDRAVSPDIRYADRQDQSWYYGAVLDDAQGWPRHLQAAEQPPRDQGCVSTEVLTGCCFAAHSEVWRTVGLFDEGMFLIFEDSDWSMRARRFGYQLTLEPASVIHHKVSRSFAAAGNGIGLFYFCRNGLVFARRWLGLRAWWTFMLRMVLPLSVRRRSTVPLAAGLASLVRAHGQAPRIVSRLP